MEGRVGSTVLGDHLRKHLAEGFLGNVDFVDKIYGGNIGEYLTTNTTTVLHLSLNPSLHLTLLHSFITKIVSELNLINIKFDKS